MFPTEAAAEAQDCSGERGVVFKTQTEPCLEQLGEVWAARSQPSGLCGGPKQARGVCLTARQEIPLSLQAGGWTNGVRSPCNVELKSRRICKWTCWSKGRLGSRDGECDTVLRQACEIPV